MVGDYTSFQLTIFEIPKGNAKAVAGLLNEHGLGYDWDTRYPTDRWDAASVREHMATGEQFTDHDYRVGNSDGLADELAKLEVSFMCWEDPKYEWLGVLNMYHPNLGLLCRECDAQGNIVMPLYQWRTIAKRHISGLEKVRLIDEFFGKQWTDKFNEYQEV